MRPLINKYPANCRKCGESIPVGTSVIYEKRVGVFCLGCAPTDTEEIRTYRQEAADRRADKLDEWAEKREDRANAQLTSYPSIRHDIAFNTQPGHIPFRARMIKADDRAIDSLDVAAEMRSKADRLRNVVVNGDAEKAYQARRDKVMEWLKVGTRVFYLSYRKNGTVQRISKKTASVMFDGFDRPLKTPIEWLQPEKTI